MQVTDFCRDESSKSGIQSSNSFSKFTHICFDFIQLAIDSISQIFEVLISLHQITLQVLNILCIVTYQSAQCTVFLCLRIPQFLVCFLSGFQFILSFLNSLRKSFVSFYLVGVYHAFQFLIISFQGIQLKLKVLVRSNQSLDSVLSGLDIVRVGDHIPLKTVYSACQCT